VLFMILVQNHRQLLNGNNLSFKKVKGKSKRAMPNFKNIKEVRKDLLFFRLSGSGFQPDESGAVEDFFDKIIRSQRSICLSTPELFCEIGLMLS
jgi:hypothetical protein